MSSFAKLSANFWLGKQGRALRALGNEAQALALYLSCNDHSNMLGVYRLPLDYIACDLAMPIEKVNDLMRGLCESRFCTYDKEEEFVWVYDLARQQIGDTLTPQDNRIAYIHQTIQTWPALSFLNDFYTAYQACFHLELRVTNADEIIPTWKQQANPFCPAASSQQPSIKESTADNKIPTQVTETTPDSVELSTSRPINSQSTTLLSSENACEVSITFSELPPTDQLPAVAGHSSILPPSKGLRSPFQAPLDPLRSPYEAPSKTLRSIYR